MDVLRVMMAGTKRFRKQRVDGFLVNYASFQEVECLVDKRKVHSVYKVS